MRSCVGTLEVSSLISWIFQQKCLLPKTCQWVHLTLSTLSLMSAFSRQLMCWVRYLWEVIIWNHNSQIMQYSTSESQWLSMIRKLFIKCAYPLSSAHQSNPLLNSSVSAGSISPKEFPQEHSQTDQ